MGRLLGSVAFRLALGYGVLVVITLTVISPALYFGTVVVIDRGIDAKLSSGRRPVNSYRTNYRTVTYPSSAGICMTCVRWSNS